MKTILKCENLEKIIADIHREFAPDAIVQHNIKLLGRSGRKRQVDVLIRGSIGIYPLRVAVECKNYNKRVGNKRVGIEKVEAFITKLKDIDANIGVMISSSGYDDGAKAQANNHNVILLNMREAEEADWKDVFSDEHWMHLFIFEVVEVKAYIKPVNSVRDYPYPDELLGNEGDFIAYTIQQLLLRIHEFYPPPSKILLGSIFPDENNTTVLVNIDGIEQPVEAIYYKITFSVKSYSFLATIDSERSQVIETTSKEPKYKLLS
jgi:hypothetical protein